MPETETPRRDSRRDVLFFATPALWPAWPFLPVVRRRPGQEEECGLLFDFFGTGGRTGLSSAVFHCNLFALPRTLGEFAALPREVFDSPEEVAVAGWTVD